MIKVENVENNFSGESFKSCLFIIRMHALTTVALWLIPGP